MPRTHVVQQTVTIFEIIRDIITKLKNVPPQAAIFFLIQDIMRKNVLTKSQDDWTINVISIALTREHASYLDRHAFQPIGTIFQLFHTAQEINVASRMLKRKNATPPGYHGFQTSVRHFNSTQHGVGVGTDDGLGGGVVVIWVEGTEDGLGG
ncbi:hypothetical protein DPMN_050864 [Dreissena polymorpha]|uniref:Uncharacterized protein n=1 Tax=Dreissena polymorpha TaxID=45954 RepID=A0A9D4HNH5_DREPO|nr:hypothetical protein DPMN_050864 [Dreissena polymorpha]